MKQFWEEKKKEHSLLPRPQYILRCFFIGVHLICFVYGISKINILICTFLTGKNLSCDLSLNNLLFKQFFFSIVSYFLFFNLSLKVNVDTGFSSTTRCWIGMTRLRSCIILPLATGMSIVMCLLTLRQIRPSAKSVRQLYWYLMLFLGGRGNDILVTLASTVPLILFRNHTKNIWINLLFLVTIFRYVIWFRIDQKTCLKAIVTAGMFMDSISIVFIYVTPYSLCFSLSSPSTFWYWANSVNFRLILFGMEAQPWNWC